MGYEGRLAEARGVLVVDGDVELFPRILGFLGASVALLFPAMSQRASAFGGLWSSETGSVSQTGLQLVFVDNPDDTVTAVVRVSYEGPPERFAWVIPVPGTPAVEMSSSTVFERLDAATLPEYWLEVAADGTCVELHDPEPMFDPGPGIGSTPSVLDGAAASVAVNEQGAVGPYEYVNIQIDPAAEHPADVAIEWLTANGYDLAGLDREALTPYLEDGLNLLAFKLAAAAAGAGAIRPVMLTYAAEQPSVPLRAAAVAAREDMGVQVWVFGPTQAVADNYKSLVLNDARIDWLTARRYASGTLPGGGAGPFGPRAKKPDNYDALVSAAADEAGGRGFVTELAGPASQYRDKVWSSVDDEGFAGLTGQSYADGLDAIFNAYTLYGAWEGWKDAIEGAITLSDGVSLEEFGRSPEQYRGEVAVDTAMFFSLLEERVVKPVQATAALFSRAPYLTRLYTTVSVDELTVDPRFDYNFDLDQISNVHIARQFVACGSDDAAVAWRVELPQGGVITGEGSAGWPAVEDSMPANLKVVMLSNRGPGTVVKDNSEAIGKTLLEAAGTLGSSVPRPRHPEHGATIGGAQTVVPHDDSDAMDGAAMAPGAGGCSVGHAGARTSLAPWLLLLLILTARRWRGAALTCALCILAACSSDAGGAAPAPRDAGDPILPRTMTLEQLRDPETCKGCHPIHYREWSSSMHAYAARDPVFLAMNERGQRETKGELGDFCVRCHAPMAVVDGTTQDGLNLEQLPDIDRGVSCYFCHNVVGIEGDHNAKLRLANDETMRGPIRDPMPSSMHRAEFSELFDEPSPKSSEMCGACHDIVTPNGVHLERTFMEYKAGVFSKSASGEPPAFDSCVGCHMPGRETVAATVPGAGIRTVHEHVWPGVDVALTDFPYRDAMRSAVEDCQLRLGLSFFTLEVTPPDVFTFQMENSAGHNTPSGATQDRRMWLEFMAYDASGNLLAQSSGDIEDDEIEERPEGHPEHDPQLFMLRDRIYDAQGKPVHMFWEAEKSAAYPDGYTAHALPVATTTYVEGKHAVVKQYRAAGPDGGLPARVTARLRMRPMGLDVLQSLVDSGDLDPAIVAQMPTFTFGAQIEWTPDKGVGKTIVADQAPADCITYRCLIDSTSPNCEN